MQLLRLAAGHEELEGGHRADPEALRQRCVRVHVQLEEVDVRVLAGERGEDGRDGAARPAPLGEEVDDDELRRLGFDERVEVVEGGDGAHGGGVA